jgi:hypothetical protein
VATFSNNENGTTSTQNGIRATVVSVSVSPRPPPLESVHNVIIASCRWKSCCIFSRSTPEKNTKECQEDTRNNNSYTEEKNARSGGKKKGFSMNEEKKEKDEANTPQCKLHRERERDLSPRNGVQIGSSRRL